MKIPCFVVLCLLYLCAGSVCFSATLYVDDNGPNDPDPGDTGISDPNENGTADHPFDAIQEAIDFCNPNDTILILDGTYTGDGNWDMVIQKALSIESENGPETCIIDLENNEGIPHGGFIIPGVVSGQVSLSGLCIQNALDLRAVNSIESNIILKNCIFRYNSGTSGTIRCGSSTNALIKQCLITENVSTSSGGGVYSDGMSSLIMEDCEISNNTSVEGGGIYIVNGRIENCIIRGNSASGRGGGIYAGNLSISNSLVCENTAMEHGGGLYTVGTIDSQFIHISGCTIVNNRTFIRGGGVWGDARIANSIIRNNSAYAINDGQQIGVRSLLLLNDCTLSDNENDIFVIDEQTDIVTNDVIYSDPNFIDAGYWDPNGTVSDWSDDFFVGGDYHLRPDSPCTDAGNNQLMELSVVQDIDGHVRTLDGDLDGQSDVDMGCYEFCPEGMGVIQTDPVRVYFTFEQGDPAQLSQAIRIYNSGAGILNWTLAEDCPWLEADVTSGSADASGIDVILTVDTAGLDPDVYTCHLSLIDAASLNSPCSVTVVLYIVPEIGCWVPFHYPTIQEAVDAAESGQTVLLADGQYWGEHNSSIHVSKPVTLKSATGPQHCIVSGAGTFSYSGFYIDIPGAAIEGLTLTGFNGDNASAIRCIQSDAFIRDCIFLNNNALFNNRYGAAIFSGGGNPTIENCTFSGNVSGYGGAVRAVSTQGETIEFSGCRFFQNLALSDYPSGGGAVYLDNALTEFDGCSFEENYAGNGSAICSQQESILMICNSSITQNHGRGVEAGTAEIENCQFVGNEGGGLEIYLPEGTAQVSGCLFESNTTTNEGGGIYYRGGYGGQLTVTNSRFVRNHALSYGAGVYGYGGILNLDHVIIEGNISEGLSYSNYEPWIYDPMYTPSIEGEGLFMNNCLIYGNRSEYFLVGGVVLSGSASINNSIIWNNESDSQPINQSQLAISNGELDIIYCDLMGGVAGMTWGAFGSISNILGEIECDPMFVQPGYWQDNGTPEDWSDDTWVEGDYHLKSAGWRWDAVGQGWTWDDVTSPCIDAGNPGMPLGDEPMPEDIDAGNLRGENIRINMGLYGRTAEASVAPPGWALLADLDNSGDVNLLDFTIMTDLWLEIDENLPADVSRDGQVRLEDMSLLVQDWLNTTVWY